MSWFLWGLLCFPITGPAHSYNIKRIDAVGLHRLIDKEEESGQEGQHQQLRPRERAAARRFRLSGERRCKHGPGGGRGGGTRHAGESIREAVLGVRGGFGGVWREQRAPLPQLAGFHWALGGSFDGSPTRGAASRSIFIHLRPCCQQCFFITSTTHVIPVGLLRSEGGSSFWTSSFSSPTVCSLAAIFSTLRQEPGSFQRQPWTSREDPADAGPLLALMVHTEALRDAPVKTLQFRFRFVYNLPLRTSTPPSRRQHWGLILISDWYKQKRCVNSTCNGRPVYVKGGITWSFHISSLSKIDFKSIPNIY